MRTGGLVEERIRVYLGDAREFLREAEEEFRRGVESGDLIKVRDAAEKAWNAVVQATNALLLHALGKVPSSHFERRKMLSMLEDKLEVAEKLGFRDRYSARERNLHELTFQEGIVDLDEVRRELKKAEKYINDVSSLMEGSQQPNTP